MLFAFCAFILDGKKRGQATFSDVMSRGRDSLFSSRKSSLSPFFVAFFMNCGLNPINLQPVMFEVPVYGFLNGFLQGILRLKR